MYGKVSIHVIIVFITRFERQTYLLSVTLLGVEEPGFKHGRSSSGALPEEQRASRKPGEGSLSFGGAHTGGGGPAFHTENT